MGKREFRRRRRLFEIIEVGNDLDKVSRAYDYLNVESMGSSLCMYSLEHEAQPDVFRNAFSGIWWAASTLLTVGYGDIYPVTMLGKIFGIVITFLGVGMVAIPTGIISAGFVDQYSRIKKRSEYGYELDVHFLKISIILAMIKRQEQLIIPRGDVVIEEDDIIILGAEPYDEVEKINLTEVVLKREHVWTGHGIKRLDISKHSLIVIVKRKNKTLIPNGNMVLHSGDRVIMYTNMNLGNATVDEI